MQTNWVIVLNQQSDRNKSDQRVDTEDRRYGVEK